MIGIFDSGVGGMTVAHAIEQTFPDQRLVYFGDLARTPYGSKSPETIIKYAHQNIEFLIEKGAKLIIVACNSAASVSAEEIRKSYDLPVFDVIGPAVQRVGKLAKGSGRQQRVGVIGTRATVKSGVYAQKIQEICPGASVYSKECPLLVPLVEEGWIDKRETKMILRRYLHDLKEQQVDSLVLGCTHYPLLKRLIQPRIGKRVTIIDSSEEVALDLLKYMQANPEFAEKMVCEGENEFYVSDVTDAAVATAGKIFGRKIDLLKV